jgi:RNA polymerase-binding transcription factor DksA
MERPITNFEQIPVATVKKIAQEFSATSETGEPTQNGDISTVDDWQDVAQQVQNETDSNKLIELVQELIEKLDKASHEKIGQLGT